MSKEISTVSIAMTTYNGEKFLIQQLNSILKQSYQDFEIIICDDCSTDKTIEILENYEKKYSNIKLYKNPVQLGSVKNFEQAINICQGKYIALSDQDDIWSPDKLKICIESIHKLEQQYSNIPLMIHSDLSTIDEYTKEIDSSYLKFRNYQLKNEKDLSHILGPCGVMGNTILMNHKLKESILPFPPHLVVHDYWIALINELYGKRITIQTPLVNYRIHQTNLSNTKEKIKGPLFSKFKKSLTLDFHLPYMEIHREKLLHYLLLHYPLDKNDKILITKFITYLEQKKNPYSTFLMLIKNNFVKKGFFYRLELFIKLLLTRRYR